MRFFVYVFILDLQQLSYQYNKDEMVKFFLKNQNHPPKSHPSHKNKQTSKPKPKKVLDYRIIIWKKLFNLIKTEHSLMLQKIIRKIKQTKQKLQLRQGEAMGQVENQAKISQLKKNLTSLDAKYQAMKSLKKPQLKQITLYIILQVLKIQNIQKILQKAKLNKSLETQKIKQQLQNNEAVKKFIEKLSLLAVYRKELEVCAQLVDLVQEKKLERKTKLKERRERKYERENKVKEEKVKGNEQEQKSEQDNDQEISSNQKVMEEEKQKKLPAQPMKKFQKIQNKNHEKKDHRQQKFNKLFVKQSQTSKPPYTNKKPIHKQRTQFRKTGRNKLKYEKEQKKLHFKKRGKEAKQQQQNSSKQQKPVPKRKGQFAFSKEQAHPSWKAKQELKQEVYIQPFQGKKIFL